MIHIGLAPWIRIRTEIIADPQHCLKSKFLQAILAESRVVDVLMSCAMSVAERCRVDTPQGLAVEPGREEPTLKVSSDSFFLISIVL